MYNTRLTVSNVHSLNPIYSSSRKTVILSSSKPCPEFPLVPDGNELLEVLIQF